MNKKIYSLMLTVLALTGLMSSCSDKDDIVFDHERQQFETRSDRILLEFIAPFGTTADEEIYIVGAFNGDSAAIGNEMWLAQKAPKSDVKWGIYLDPNTFEPGKTLANGFRFYSATQGMEYTINGELAQHTDNPGVGTFTNIWGQRWESYYRSGGGDDEEEVDHDGFVVYVDDQTGWDNLTLYMWGDVNDLNGGWPGMSVTGTVKKGGITWKYFDMGAANSGLSENLIFNNGGNGVQLADFAFTIDRNIYLRVTAEGVEEVELESTVKHDGYALFVLNESSQTDLALYAWGDAEAFGGWPGMPATGTQTIGGKEYIYFDLGEGNTGLSLHLIPNNNGGGVQWEGDDLFFTIDHDIYIRIWDGDKLSYEVLEGSGGGGGDTPTPQPTGETHKFYINDLTGWSGVGLYAWGDGLPELFGGWPGKTDYTTETVGGVSFKVFEFTSNGDVYNPIFNGDGGQIDGPAVTTDRDRYFEVSASAFVEIEKPVGNAHKIYINNQTGWTALGLYAWGDGLPELFGGWPGKTEYTTETVNGTDYQVFTYEGEDMIYNLILNNAGAGSQVDGPMIVLGKDYFFTVDENGWSEENNAKQRVAARRKTTRR